jgi:hypothetical protein
MLGENPRYQDEECREHDAGAKMQGEEPGQRESLRLGSARTERLDRRTLLALRAA